MIAQERLEAIVRNLMMDGLDARTIARKTGVPVERVQRIAHQVNGRDPDQAAKATRKRRARTERALFGTTLAAPRQYGPNSKRTSDGRR